MHIVALSSTKVKCRALAYGVVESHWITYVIFKLHSHLVCPSTLWFDHIDATCVAMNPTFHQHMKHIDIDSHFIRDKVLYHTL